MGMDEKDVNKDKEHNNIEKELLKHADDVEIPEKLKPENIEKLLKTKNLKSKFQWKTACGIMAAAACCVLVIGVTSWRQRGGEVGKSADTMKTSDKAQGDQMIASAKDYDEIFTYIEAEQENVERMSGLNAAVPFAYVREGAIADDATSGAGMESAKAESDVSYSDTNIRESGVEEGDIVKTDGKNLYILNNQKVQIVNIETDEMDEAGAIRVDDDQYIREIYLKDGALIVVYTRTDYTEGKEGYGGAYQIYTIAETFDVSNPANPKSIGKITQSGDFNTMRVTEEHVYLLSDFYVNTIDAKKQAADSYIPEVQGKLLEGNSILLPQYKRGNQYTVISSFSLKNPAEKIDGKAVFGGGGLVYVSGENIYVCESYYDSDMSDVTETCIRKVSYESGKLQGVGQTRIHGTLNDSFSIDEYEGNLRLVTTVNSTGSGSAFPIITFGTRQLGEKTVQDSNSLYILDEDLQELGKIEGLAVDEQVYSARFMGDVGYFVTFKQVDPLFSVDLSDSTKPEILGSLKIPGFSEYLHPYGENLLLGIGMDVDETGTTTNGVKLSMFDTSDPKDVKEVQKYVLENTYSTEVFYNYKAVLINKEKNLFGFAAYGDSQHYYLFTYDKSKGFQTIFDRELNGYQSGRGIYAEEKFYILAGNTIESYEMGTFNKIDDIVL